MILIELWPLVRRELLEEALRDECRERNVLSVFLHLFLGILWTLERKVLQSGQHPAPGVDGADQLVGGAQRDREGQVLGVLLGSQGGDDPSRSLQPANNLKSTVCGQLRICKRDLSPKYDNLVAQDLFYWRNYFDWSTGNKESSS